MLIDSHAHLNFDDFQGDWPEVIRECQKNNIWMINVGSQWLTSKKAVAMAEKYDQGVYAAIGLHPIHVTGSDFHPEEFIADDYRGLIKLSKKVAAIGETGLDFYHSDKNIANQKKVFIQQLDLAKEFGLPVILHARNSKDGKQDAYEEILKILTIKRESDKAIEGVIHCFGGTVKQALAFLQQGFYIGFTGVITFDKTGQTAEVLRNLPLDAILVETDCPYLAPVPHRGERNQPLYVKYVAQKIAEIKGLEYNVIEKQTRQNTINLFKLS